MVIVENMIHCILGASRIERKTSNFFLFLFLSLLVKTSKIPELHGCSLSCMSKALRKVKLKAKMT